MTFTWNISLYVIVHEISYGLYPRMKLHVKLETKLQSKLLISCEIWYENSYRNLHYIWSFTWNIFSQNFLRMSRLLRRTRGNTPLHWHHNERDGVSHHWRLYCWLIRMFRRRSKNTSKLCAYQSMSTSQLNYIGFGSELVRVTFTASNHTLPMILITWSCIHVLIL